MTQTATNPDTTIHDTELFPQAFGILAQGEHMFPVGRGSPSPSPPRNCISIEMGKSWPRRMVCGSCEWSMTPLLRIAHDGAPGCCTPTKRYSILIR